MIPSASQTPAGSPPSAGEAGDSTGSHVSPRHGASADSRLRALGWTTRDRWFAISSGVIIVLLLLAHWGRVIGGGAPAVEIERLETAENRFQLDINRATWVEWMQLEGVGETLSRRIVEDREQNGPFASIDDIQRVRGIGPKTLEELRPWLACADCPSAAADGDDR